MWPMILFAFQAPVTPPAETSPQKSPTVVAPAQPGDLNPLIARYKAYKNITFTVVHHGDVGPEGKDNADRIYWTGGRFEVTPIAFGENNASALPKLVCNDGRVTTFLNNGDLLTSQQDPGPDSIGAWEARGGILLDWLMDGKVWKRMVQPQEGVAIKFSAGSETTWHDRPARQIALEHSSGTYSDKFLIFVSPKGDELLGTQYDVAGKTIWTEFRDEVAQK